MLIFLVEPYFGGSHQAWAEGYRRSSGHDVHLLTLPARFWKWRMRGAALTLAVQAEDLTDRYGPPDLVLASDMLDLPAFLALTRRSLGGPAVALYMHENQIGYPPPPGAETDLSYGFINWLSAAASDLIIFNSRFHLEEFFGMLPGLLDGLPDFRHTASVPAVRARSEVLPVGIDVPRAPRFPPAGSPTLLWNQRWEYDKDPVALFRALYRLDAEGHDFRVILAGENFRNVPGEFEEARRRLAGRLLHYGYAPQDEYADLLLQSDIVVSTARHEYFGVAVVEAIAAGAFPVLPGRLSYPELIPSEYHDACLYRSEDEMLELLRWALQERTAAASVAGRLAEEMRRYDWSTVAPAYDRLLDELAAGRKEADMLDKAWKNGYVSGDARCGGQGNSPTGAGETGSRNEGRRSEQDRDGGQARQEDRPVQGEGRRGHRRDLQQ